MTEYLIYFANSESVTVQAHSFVQSENTVYFLDETGETVSAWNMANIAGWKVSDDAR